VNPVNSSSSTSPLVSTSVTIQGEVGTADRRLFGSFVEHLGRGVYGGIYEPAHASATPEGFRGDVIELVRELGVTVVRYPGGNFVSGYDWRDGIGPRARRPRRLDLAWKTIETNEFGLDEFLAWCRLVGVEPMLALNLGLGTVREALMEVEYVNHTGGTALSDARAANGSPAPYGVRVWCLGNELDGPWQLGHRSAQQYASLAAMAASAIRMFDPELELVAVGSSTPDMPTLGEWEEILLASTSELIDFVSCHIYFHNDGDIAAFARSSDRVDALLDRVGEVIARARESNPLARDIKISLDEWNVWDHPSYESNKAAQRFEVAPRLLEDRYTMADAVVVGSVLQRILAHADTVAIAALAQLVNVLGAIRAEPGAPAWRQTIFYPFAAMAGSAGHTVLRTVSGADSPVVTTVTRSPEGDQLRVYFANRSVDSGAVVAVDLAGFEGRRVETATLLWHPDPYAANDLDDPGRVAPQPLDVAFGDDGILRVELPPLAWASVLIATRRARE